MAKEIYSIPGGSESGGRLGAYGIIKSEPVAEIYVTLKNSAGGGESDSWFKTGMPTLAVEVGRYTGIPYM